MDKKLKFGVSYCTQPNVPELNFMEVRQQQPISYINLDEVYHHLLYDKYIRPTAGFIGKYCLIDYINAAKKNNQELIITLNFRNDSGDKRTWSLRPIEEYVRVAQVCHRLKEFKVPILFNIGNETFYRYRLKWQQILPYIKAIKPILNDTGFKLGGVGDEFITFDQHEGTIKLKEYLDFVTIHFLYTPLAEIENIYSWLGKLCVLETGAQTKDYRNATGYLYIKYLLDGYVANSFKVSHVAFIYVDSNYWGDANYIMRMWDSKYEQILHSTITWDLYKQYIEKWGEKRMEYRRPPGLQAVYDIFGWNFPYHFLLPNLPILGEKDPNNAIKWADVDAIKEIELKGLIVALKNLNLLPPQFPNYPDIKYIGDKWNSNWLDIAKKYPEIEEP